MRAFDVLRTEILGVFAVLTPLARRTDADETARRLGAAEHRLRDGRLTVVVCGEFKRGKSRLLNALLDEPELFPTDTTYATSLVTTVTYGSQEKITVSVEDGAGGLSGVPIGRDEIRWYATESGNPRNDKKARLVAVETPNPKLSSGLTLVDTPGVGGVYEEHTVVTAGFLPQADALIFVADVTQPLTDSELAFLARAAELAKITDDADAQVFVLTKIDVVGDYQAMLANTTAKVAQVTGRQVEVVPVSSQAKLDYLGSEDPEDLELSNFGRLEEVLWAALARRRARLVLGDALATQEAAARALLRPVETAIEALKKSTEEELRALKGDLAAKEARLNELMSNTAAWRQDARELLHRLGRELVRRGQDELGQVWHRLDTKYLYDDDYLDEPELLVSQVMADVTAVAGAVGLLAERRGAKVVAEISRSNGLDLGTPAAYRLPPPPVPDIEVTGRLGDDEQAVSDYRQVRDVVLGSSTGERIGGVIGSVLGGIVGTVLGAGAGAVAGVAGGGWLGKMAGRLFGAKAAYRETERVTRIQDRKARRQSLKVELMPLRQAQERYLAGAVEELTGRLTRAVVAELDSRIAQEKESVTAATRRLRGMEQDTVKQSRERLAVLEAERRPLDRALGQIAGLAAEVAGLGGHRPPPDMPGSGPGAAGPPGADG
ncbi:dynamin family protein [Microbispora sp. NPDC049125]|uniref:dynamin family protein n=1 Tax=Microbispora sp. NPDC049125 TaxID=3154929 RepID=UPI003466B192